MTTTRTLALATVSLFLAACQTQTIATAPVAPRPQGIEGQWVDPNGIVSSFAGGRFETRTTDSNSLLAEGPYQYISDQVVEIDITSLLRNTTSKVNCALVTPAQLNCTSATGSQFSLFRRA